MLVDHRVHPHPEDTADAATLASWARITREYEARNYTKLGGAATRHVTRRHKNFHAKAPYDGSYGVDVSSGIGTGTWQCLVNAGYSSVRSAAALATLHTHHSSPESLPDPGA